MSLSICRWNHTASEVGRHITETHVRHSSSVLDKGEFSSCSMPWPGTPIKLSIEKHLIDFQKMLPKCEIFNCRFLLPKKKPLYHLSICICIVYTRSGIMCQKNFRSMIISHKIMNMIMVENFCVYILEVGNDHITHLCRISLR